MAIPNLPTDNLYKFLALAGIVIAFGCFGLLEHRDNEQNRLNIEVRLGIEELEYKERRWTKSLESFEQKLTLLEQEPNKQKTQQIRLDFDELIKSSPITVEGVMSLRKKSETAELFENRFERISLLLWLGGISGVLVSILGFVFWYVRLQKFQDINARGNG